MNNRLIDMLLLLKCNMYNKYLKLYVSVYGIVKLSGDDIR